MTLETGVKVLAEAVAVDVKALSEGKVDKELGKGLSEEDFTGALRDKLDSVKGWATAETQGAALDALEFSSTGKAIAGGSAAQGRGALELGTFATANYSAAPFFNLMPDSGRFAGKMNPLATYISGGFSSNSFFNPYNGSVISSAGKFIFDNSTNGGAAGSLDPVVGDLLAAMGRTGSEARYGVEFYVAKIVAGEGTSVGHTGADGVTRFLLCVNNAQAMFVADGLAACVAWLRVDSGSLHCKKPYFLNGVLQPSGTPIPAGFHHFRVVARNAIGYDTEMPWLCSTAGAEVYVGCAAFFHGFVDVGLHTSPIAANNELSA